MTVEAKAIAKQLRTTPRKARLVADAVRGKMVSAALPLLEYGIKRSVSRDIAKLVKSAVANLQNKNADASVNVDELRIKEIKVEEGPMLKRFRPAAHGRASRILKHMCHISVTVSN
jgi:large subunit ribosomal protein L22